MTKKDYMDLLHNETKYMEKVYNTKDKYTYSDKCNKLNKLTASTVK